MAIPIANIYYLLCYAWNTLDESDIVDVTGIRSNELSDLFARILISGTNRILKDGLDRGYQCLGEDSNYIRGRIDFNESLKRFLFRQGKVYCCSDELNYNILHNKILKTTIHRLAVINNLDPKLRSNLRHLHYRLKDIEEIELNGFVFHHVQLHRNNYFYLFLMHVCELVYDSLLVDEKTGNYRFRDFLRDEEKMANLFQSFVFNFYRIEQSEFKVKADIITWDIDASNQQSMELLPSMKTDLCLRSRFRTIVIDTKYYQSALQEHFGKETIRSSHLYQIFAYLKNLERKGGADKHAEGILLYPTVSVTLDRHFPVQGHLMRICTIDLNQPWQTIKENMLNLLKTNASPN